MFEVATAILSTTAKAKARAKKAEKDKKGDSDAMEVVIACRIILMIKDEKPKEENEKKEKTEEAAAKVNDEKTKKKEENFEIIENMSRVLPQQRSYVTIKDGSRYKPVKKVFTVVYLQSSGHFGWHYVDGRHKAE